MTESLAEQAIQPTYEQIVSSIRHSGVREMLQHARENEQRVGYELKRIESNEDLTEEAKARRAQEVIERYGPKISEAYDGAKEKLAAAAENSYKFSIPMPGDGKTLASTKVESASEMVAVQNEITTLLTRAEQMKAKASVSDKAHQGGNKGMRLAHDPRLKVLKEAYADAMEAGGIEGKVRGLAVVRAADALGLDLEAIVAEHRTKVHQGALSDADKYERALGVLPSGKNRAPTNPFGQRRGKTYVGTYGSANKAVLHPGGGGGSMFPTRKRKPSWK
jgi:hypothetical protein